MTGARWHDEADEEMVPGWHASAYLCLLQTVDGFGAVASVDRPSADSADPEVSGEESGGHDIHADSDVVMYLRTGSIPGMVNAKERDRILQCAKRFRWEGSHILRVWDDGRVRVVPPLSQRARLVRHAHEELGHFGVKRTYSLL